MFAVMGVTGQVGGALARTLLEQGRPVRALVRDESKGEPWARIGAEVAIADLDDPGSMMRAFQGVEGAFAMIPPVFAPLPGFPEARRYIEVLKRSITEATPGKVVCLSSIGAHREKGLGLITQLHMLEQELGTLPMPVAFLRAGWFMENAQWDVEAARTQGEIQSFLLPTDRAVPMVATEDIGRIGAEALMQTWEGTRIIEIEGPARSSPEDLAAAFATALGRSVKAVPVPRDRWAAIFEEQGTAPESVAPRLEMLDGFNSGWIDFEGDGLAEHALGRVDLRAVVARLVKP